MRLSKIPSEDQRLVRFCGKRKEMEKAEDLDPAPGSQLTSTSTLGNSMGTPRRSVIRPRSELFQNTFRGESDQHQPNGESHFYFNEPSIKPMVAKANSLTGQDYTLGLVRDKEVEMIWNHIYRHKKFNHTTRVPIWESNENRPSVIVTHKSNRLEDLDIDFDDIKVTSSEGDIEKIHNISKFNVQNPTIEIMQNLYFVDEVPLIDTLRNSFFAIWRTLPLGETVMGDYIRFCKDKSATLPRCWVGMTLKQTRWVTKSFAAFSKPSQAENISC